MPCRSPCKDLRMVLGIHNQNEINSRRKQLLPSLFVPSQRYCCFLGSLALTLRVLRDFVLRSFHLAHSSEPLSVSHHPSAPPASTAPTHPLQGHAAFHPSRSFPWRQAGLGPSLAAQ